MSVKIKQPKTDAEFERYFDLRWRILRAPWSEPEGSEKDELEDRCFHVMAHDDHNELLGIGRLQFNSKTEAQIRYMAVKPEYEGKGIGKLIAGSLEQHARKHGITTIILHAREPALGFYEKLGYEVTEKSYVLFNCIQHYRMHKHFG